MKKIMITKKNGRIGILKKADDGKWDISLDGKYVPTSLHYNDAQVEKIITTAKNEGSVVEII